MDVARRAEVSRRTVSNVVTGFPHVNPDTRERVQRAIEELGYVPNRAAQHLRTGRSGLIALLVPEIGVGYFGEMSNLVVEEAAARGWGTIVAQTRGSRERELLEIERVLALQPDGIILSPLGLTEHDVEELRDRCPVALIGEHFAEDPSQQTAAIDNRAAASALAEHLLGLGRTRIAFVGGHPPLPRFVALRLSGYHDALAAAGLEPALRVHTDGFNYDDGYAAGQTIVDVLTDDRDAVDAVMCATDGLAIGAMRALTDAGIDIPGRVAVTGFDDIAEGRFAHPRLTTVSPDKTQIAAAAVAALTSGRPTPTLVYRIVTRESTAGR